MLQHLHGLLDPRVRGHEVNDKSTLIFVIEINGKSVLAFNADRRIDAERKAQSPMLRSDLMVFKTADGPIWSSEDTIEVREALPVERENWLFVRAHTAPASGENDLTLQTYLSISSTRKTRPRVRSH